MSAPKALPIQENRALTGRYTNNEDRLLRLCESKQTASWRQYGSTLSSRSRMSDVWRMARRLRDPVRGSNSFSNPEGWLSDFADMLAPPFAAPDFSIPECSNRFQWLAGPLTSDEMQAALLAWMKLSSIC
jgi:hypothetical protein